jgi:hypothetical protein
VVNVEPRRDTVSLILFYDTCLPGAFFHIQHVFINICRTVNGKLRRGKDVFPPGLDEDEKIFFLSGVILS